jgi:hypothetical protein
MCCVTNISIVHVFAFSINKYDQLMECRPYLFNKKGYHHITSFTSSYLKKYEGRSTFIVLDKPSLPYTKHQLNFIDSNM